MLHSKATAALMKLKEIDKKYRMKSSEELARQRNSLSDISAVGSVDEISSAYVAPLGSGDSLDAIARPKLDIKMPVARMERAEMRRIASEVDRIEPPAEPVTIFDKSDKNCPPTSPSSSSASPQKPINHIKVTEKRTVSPAGDGNEAVSQHLETSSPPRDHSIDEERTADTDTSISEEVQEAVTSTPRSSSSISGHKGDGTSAKSVHSVIDKEEPAQSVADEDPSTLAVYSNTYSDDFVKTVSRVVSPAEDLPSSEKAKNSIVESGENLVVSVAEARESGAKLSASTSPAQHHQRQRSRVIGAVESKTSDAGLNPALSDYVDTAERRASGVKDSEEPVQDPVQLLSRSPQAASARGSKTRRRKGRRRAVTSRDSREFTSNSEHRMDPAAGRSSECPDDPHGSREAKISEEIRGRKSDGQTSRILKEETPRTITGRKIVTKVKTESAKNRMRVGAPSTAEPTASHSNDHSETQKSTPAIQPVPRKTVDSAPLGENFDAGKLRISEGQRSRSKKPKTEGNVRSKNPAKRVDPDQRKNRMKKRTESSKEESEIRFGRIVTKELRQREERDQLRRRVRGYIQQMIDERERLLLPDGFGIPVDKHARWNRCASRLRQSESPPRRYFFKPLDLPSVAAFKRPDCGEHKNAADPNRNGEYKNMYAIRDRVFGIRHWLKQQFVLYKDYSNIASTINAKYVPVTLKETKKMIRDIQRYCNGYDRCSNCRQPK